MNFYYHFTRIHFFLFSNLMWIWELCTELYWKKCKVLLSSLSRNELNKDLLFDKQTTVVPLVMRKVIINKKSILGTKGGDAEKPPYLTIKETITIIQTCKNPYKTSISEINIQINLARRKFQIGQQVYALQFSSW